MLTDSDLITHEGSLAVIDDRRHNRSMESRTLRMDPRWVLVLTILAGCAPTAPAAEPRSSPMAASTPEPAAANAATLDRNKKNVRRLFEEGFNRGDLAVLDEIVAPDFPGPHGRSGPAAFGAVYATLHTAFPDLCYEIDDVAAEGDKVAVRWHWTGTHRGPYRGFAASDVVVAPTGKPIVNPGIGVFHLRDGKIVGASLQTDQLGFLQGIGVVADNASLFGPRAAAKP
jgi:predicted ester cyclase